MSETLIIAGNSKEEQYRSLLPQLVALTDGETDFIANLANIVGALRQTFSFFWVGVYLVKGDQLVLGPFQGPIACTRISKGKGVCGTSWEKKQVMLIPDVDLFPGHISCNSDSRSEIVVPVVDENGNVILVIDVDSNKLNDFDSVDQRYLEEIAGLISVLYKKRDA
ncbi:MAG TPA: GAF domain-containing protein [Bacteroidia bacterium]|nr:GAF domain-containing protein [Bacteroidia bacterium]